MPRMYHPNLAPPNNEIVVPDDDACVRVHTESGWKPAPEPTSTSPALASEPVTYAPVTTDAPSVAPNPPPTDPRA